MCTAISFGKFFGRTLDVKESYGERIIETPENTQFPFGITLYKITGMGITSENYPLYFDGINSCGLCMAGLNFPDFAHYLPPLEHKTNIPPYELIPFILGTCKDVDEAENKLKNINIVNKDFSENYKNTPLHWIIADIKRCIVAEPTQHGVKIYNNPVGVLTNAPDFKTQLKGLNDATSIPVDNSSTSRFIRIANQKAKATENTKEEFFNILKSVTRPFEQGKQYTVYTCLMDKTRGVLDRYIYRCTK